ncbi:MAG: biotin--[acetyl-CoA-carboxylase] ligase [Elusimicrobia bacterium]|nr:biotin--[acetyl-CoA-carboxylase] ligase [Elusimicrobiota bacterium]
MDKTLKTEYIFGDRTEIYRKIGSTQERVREIFVEGAAESLVIADSQEKGYGRRGSRWESPDGGLYFSVLVRFGTNRQMLGMYALYAALESLLVRVPDACWKWPNDIMLGGKKAGGIIAEILSDEWAAVGVGINTAEDAGQYPQGLRDTLAVCSIDKKEFIGSFTANLKKIIEDGALFARENEDLNSRLSIRDKKVKVNNAEGKVLGIDTEGRLLLLTADGKTEKVMGGQLVELKKGVYPLKPIITVDIGNTYTHIGIIGSGGVGRTGFIPTRPHEDYGRRLTDAVTKIRGEKTQVDGICLSCVVTGIEKEAVSALEKNIHGDIIIAGCSASADIEVKVKNPQEVGADRICNAVAAYTFYGGSNLVIDLGTANTFDVVSGRGEYLGGVIAPGIDSIKQALIEKADRLRDNAFERPAEYIGKDTISSLNSGLYLTLVGQINAVIEAVKKEWDTDFRVIITGGGLEKLDPGMLERFVVDRDITLKGLGVIWAAKKGLDKT